jgi:hypothetical protein
MRRIFAALSGVAVAASALVAPSLSVQAAQDVSYLFVVDSTDIRATSSHGEPVEMVNTRITR